MGEGTDYAAIYRDQAEAYDAMVAAEDCDGNLGAALDAIARWDGARVLEVGAGTGRVTRLMLERGATVAAGDRSPAMLAVARRRLAPWDGTRWSLHVAEARALPVRDGWADVALAGWALGHLRIESGDDWRAALAAALGEMERALRPGGTLIVIETLGTGHEVPAPPSPAVAGFYAWLEGERGMRRVGLRTDYRFADPEAAARTTGFFFGAAFAERVRRERWSRVPECTGLWWCRTG